MTAMGQGVTTTCWYDDENDLFVNWTTAVADSATPIGVVSISYGISETAIAVDSWAMLMLAQFDIEASKAGLQGTR